MSRLLFLQSLFTFSFVFGQYLPDWESLDKRPLPQWYDEAKFGIFMHWGVYSVPSFQSEWFWWYWQGSQPNNETVQFMKDNYRPGFTYPDFAPSFRAELFDPDRYYVLTSKHHEGFTMWPSKYSWNWNAMDIGPKRDIVGEMKTAIEKVGDVRFGLYFSQFEWFNPLWQMDKDMKFNTQNYVSQVSYPQMLEFVNKYSPEVIWSDGDWGAPYQYWNATNFLAWLYNSSPVKESIVVNDRWGMGCSCHHGDFWNCADKYNPGKLVPHKWEDATTLDNLSWGHRRTMTAADVKTAHDLISLLAKAIWLSIWVERRKIRSGFSCNGNLLLNIGPTHDGRIVPIFEDRLKEIGDWLKINGEAVYGTKAWVHQNDSLTPNIWYTSTVRNSRGYRPTRLFNPQDTANTVVYAFVLDWPANGILKLMSPQSSSKTTVSLLGYAGQIMWKKYNKGILIEMNSVPWPKLPSTFAWVLKLEFLAEDLTNPEADFHRPQKWEKTPKSNEV